MKKNINKKSFISEFIISIFKPEEVKEIIKNRKSGIMYLWKLILLCSIILSFITIYLINNEVKELKDFSIENCILKIVDTPEDLDFKYKSSIAEIIPNRSITEADKIKTENDISIFKDGIRINQINNIKEIKFIDILGKESEKSINKKIILNEITKIMYPLMFFLTLIIMQIYFIVMGIVMYFCAKIYTVIATIFSRTDVVTYYLYKKTFLQYMMTAPFVVITILLSLSMFNIISDINIFIVGVFVYILYIFIVKKIISFDDDFFEECKLKMQDELKDYIIEIKDDADIDDYADIDTKEKEANNKENNKTK